MNKQFFVIILFVPLLAMESLPLIRTKDEQVIPVGINLIKRSTYLNDLFSKTTGREFAVNLTKTELNLLLNILRFSVIKSDEKILNGIIDKEIDITLFKDFIRDEFRALIESFGLSKELFSELEEIINNYTFLIGPNGVICFIKLTDVHKIPTLKALEEDTKKPLELLVPTALDITPEMMQMIITLERIDNYKELNEVLEAWTIPDIEKLQKVLAYFDFDFQAKACLILLCLRVKDYQHVLISNTLITLQDLAKCDVLPKVILTDYGKELNLNGYCLSHLKGFYDYYDIFESNIKLHLRGNRLTDLSDLFDLPPGKDLRKDLPKFFVLDASYNFLTTSSLIDNVARMPNLVALVLNNNKIVINEIEAGWAKDLIFLNGLDLSYNRMTSNIFMPGWTLGLSGVKDEKTGEVKGGLKRLFLMHNGITKLYAGWAKGLSQLEELYLQGNPIKELEKGWSQGLSNLKKIYIDKNSALAKKMNWELNGILAYFGIRKSKVKIIEVDNEGELT